MFCAAETLCHTRQVNEHLHDLAASQHGLISRSQALKNGVSAGQWGWIARSDDWKLVYPGVYRRTGAPRTYEQTLMAGALAARGFVSHRAAGALWGLPEIEPGLAITIPERRRVCLEGFDIHRATHLDQVDRGWRAAIPVTALARTVIDVCLEVPQQAPALVTHVLARRKIPLDLLDARLAAMGVQGRDGAAGLRRLFEEFRGRKRHVDSSLQREFEQIALDGYRRGLLPEPHFEFPVKLANGRWRFPDVGFPGPDVGFEALSYEHHASVGAFAKDAERLLALFGEGWIIVPVTVVQVRSPHKLIASMARILAAVEARRR